MKWAHFCFSGIRVLWSIIGVALLLFVGVQLGTHVFLLQRTTSEITNPETKESLELSYRWQPHSYWRINPFHGKYTHIDGDGLRKTWNPHAATSKPLRIFMFGGSALWGMGNNDEATIPSILSHLLSQNAGLDVQVTNFAQPAYVNSQELVALLLELQQNHIPEIAIFYDGFDDIHGALLNQSAGESGLEFARRRTFNNLPYGNEKNILKKLKTYFPLRKSDMPTPFPYFIPEKINSQIKEKLAQDVVNVYFSNINLINQLGNAEQFHPLFYWQPLLFSKRVKLPTEKAWPEKTAGADFYSKIIDRIDHSSSLNATKHFHNLSHVLDHSTEHLYMNVCNLTKSGNERIAQLMAGDILQIITRNKVKHLRTR